MTAELAEATGQARDFQDFLDIQRRWANDAIFQVGAHMLRGRLKPVDASGPLSDIADTCLTSLLPEIKKEFADTHGHVPGGEMAVIAFGKLGSREMMPGSDLDLLFVYDSPRPTLSSPMAGALCRRDSITVGCASVLSARLQRQPAKAGCTRSICGCVPPGMPGRSHRR